MMALLLATGLSTMQAQTKEDMQAAKERCEKLTKLLDNKPKSTSIPDVDQYVDWVNTAAATSMANSEQLRNLYYRSIGETEDGVTDVTVKKPTLEELTQLSTTIAAQAVSMKEAVSSAQKAATAAKDAKGRATVKAAKALAYTKDAYPILVEETEAQGKAIAAMIETAKTAKNL
ncbi:MAG: hypothetical protein LUC45_08195 [Paraprevotella sp.]|nr:hypothetical protein [Paraprevotella sp.]